MVRIVLGVIAGFFAWAIVWFGMEKILSAVMPEWYGAPQLAFQQAVENGPSTPGFTVETRLLVMHIVIGSIIAVVAGYVAALIARENRRAPLILGFLLLALGLMKVAITWPYVPVWSHTIFTAILLPMAIIGGRLKTTISERNEIGRLNLL